MDGEPVHADTVGNADNDDDDEEDEEGKKVFSFTSLCSSVCFHYTKCMQFIVLKSDFICNCSS